MFRWTGFLLFVILTTGAVATAHAQDRERDRPSRAAYTPLHLEREVRDAESGVVRARYRIDDSAVGGRPEAAAREHLARRGRDYGIEDAGRELRLIRVRETARSRHVTFEQIVDGVPVFGRHVHVNTDAAGRPSMVISGFDPALSRIRAGRPTLNENAAIASAERIAGQALTVVIAPRLVVYPAETPTLAYHLVVRPLDDRTEWSILIDARRGELLEWTTTSSHAHRSKRGLSGPEVAPAARVRSTDLHATTLVDGIGYVFDPDPLTTAGVQYGAPYVNANDADIPELNDQRVLRPLLEITQFGDGRYRLQGPYVTIVGSDVIGASYVPPAPITSEFRYTRSNDFFEAVNAYHHVDASQRHTQSLGIDVRRFPVRVNPHGLGSLDDSQFLPASNAILFGTGGIDDAEDAEVIWHEYAHAMLEDAAPGLLGTNEGRALHEGWADYWAVSYTRELIESGAVPPRDWRKFATWDGNETWQGRYLDHAGRYPDDAPCALGGFCNIYRDGLLWATTLMEIWTELGRETTDRLNLASHFYLSAPVTMRDAAEALIQADLDLHDGAHSNVLSDILSRRGFIELAAPLPIVTHRPPPSRETTGGSIVLTVDVESFGQDVTARLVHAFGGDSPETTNMVAIGDGRYEASVDLPSAPGVLRYHVEVEDALGRTVRSPATAPGEQFAIEFGPDTAPPTIRHDAPSIVNLVEWPLRITATITDRTGVSEAVVAYRVDDMEGSFALSATDSVWTGTFPPIPVDAGDIVSYRVIATDSAVAVNVGTHPSDGWHTFLLTDGSVLRAFDLDGETDLGIQPAGVWARGEPRYGVLFAHEGRNVWATRPAGRYPSSAGISTLSLPSIDLSSVEGAKLVFWHWFDTEHDGHAIGPRPRPNAAIYDGGNVSLSIDGGATWMLAAPDGGYTGTIAGGYGNALGGQPGFGGHSLGWRRVVIPLPQSPDVRIRFDFATDEGNSEQSVGYAGWYLDGISVRLDVPESASAPSIMATPLQTVRAGHAGPLPLLDVTVTDDLGVESVRLPYVVRDGMGGAVRSDTAFLSMHPADRTRYAGRIMPGIDLEPGWRVEYGVHAVDVSGNETSMDGPLNIRIVYEEQRSVLESVRATGVWHRVGARWSTTGDGPATGSSSLLLAPIDLPIDTEALQLAVRQTHQFPDGAGGNVRASIDDGRTWMLLSPLGGYDDRIGGDHTLASDSGFVGSNQTLHTRHFDLGAFAGEQVRIRFDVAGENALWTLDRIDLRIMAEDADIEIPRRYTLHAPYPNPVRGTTTLGYSLETPQTVLLEVIDLLGRRIDVLVWAVQNEGVYVVPYDASHLPAGSYIISLTTDAGRLSRRIVKVN